jgi:hypothetical protein
MVVRSSHFGGVETTLEKSENLSMSVFKSQLFCCFMAFSTQITVRIKNWCPFFMIQYWIKRIARIKGWIPYFSGADDAMPQM